MSTPGTRARHRAWARLRHAEHARLRDSAPPAPPRGPAPSIAPSPAPAAGRRGLPARGGRGHGFDALQPPRGPPAAPLTGPPEPFPPLVIQAVQLCGVAVVVRAWDAGGVPPCPPRSPPARYASWGACGQAISHLLLRRRRQLAAGQLSQALRLPFGLPHPPLPLVIEEAHHPHAVHLDVCNLPRSTGLQLGECDGVVWHVLGGGLIHGHLHPVEHLLAPRALGLAGALGPTLGGHIQQCPLGSLNQALRLPL